MLVAALAASTGFALPVATPPNTIVFGSGQVSVRQMARAGILLDLVAIVVIVAAVSLLYPLVFG
jgi:sodium-dependent dicarboxylate transporter 2/3/5